MDQEKFGKLIKDIRRKNNLTQKDLADKLNVTYQAVSKWENGKNMPDKSVLKQISKEFNVSLDSLFDGEYKENNGKNNNKKIIFVVALILLLLIVFIILFLKFHNDDFMYKNLSSSCDDFTITGSISYNDSKSAIFINNIEYCGNLDENMTYKHLECALYEVNDNIEKKISSYKDKEKTLEEFLKDVTFSLENKDNICKDYNENSLYLLISLEDKEGRITTYKVPLSVNNCNS